MEDTRRKSTSVQQLDLLITFMEAHTNFAVGQLRSKEGRVLATRMWHRCADILNSEGVARTPKDWSRFWNDYKCRVRTKLAEINRGYRGTGGGPSRAPQLSPLEERVAALLGRDVGPLTGVRQDPEIEIELVNAEEIEVQQDVQQDVELPATNSPVLDLSIIADIAESTEAPANRSPATQDLSRLVTLESQQRDSARDVEENNQPADHGSTLPQTGRPRHRQPRPTRPGPTARAGGRPRFVHQSNTAALDESRATRARIEEMRARTEEMVATAALNMTNSMTSFSTAMIGISNAMSGIANAITSMAESLRTYVSPSDS